MTSSGSITIVDIAANTPAVAVQWRACIRTQIYYKKMSVFFFIVVFKNYYYCMTQHLHFGFFLSTTCSASPGELIVSLLISTAPGLLLPFKSFKGGGADEFNWFIFLGDWHIGDVASTVLAGVAVGLVPPLCIVWSASSPFGIELGAVILSGVGVIGLPPLIRSNNSSASLSNSPPGRNGLSQPLSVLKKKN